MKNLLLVVALLCIPTISFAQSTGFPTEQPPQTQQQVNIANQCAFIDSFNYNSCCKTFLRAQNLGKCTASVYETGNTSRVGGTEQTPDIRVVNTTTDRENAAVIAGTPTSSASELKQCSDIKFVSLLDIIVWVKCIIVAAIIPLIFALATLFFMWGVMKFIMASDSAKKEEGKKFIMAGLIGLFVMTSLWGIISIVGRTLGTGSAVPVLQTSSLKKTP